MCSWLSVAIATVTCLSISPIACLPLHDVADGSERRELLHTWLEPSDVMTNPGPKEFAQSAKSLLLAKPRDSGSVLDLLLALRDPNNDPRELGHQGEAEAVLSKRGQSKVDDYGHGMFWGKRGAWLQHDEVKTGRADQQTKRAHDEYGFGLFFGKRDDSDYDDFTL
ncbi:uncharacterized protein LOC119740447 [Patiria miniata]|uniref:Uncharacterized protein n=1 Tax=Patiria miniata TaxID=46514 RepID=A0A914B636_PATMI|nr:uncharacterized protein LOC119740413 [Patiria miniata]XP_038071691.1 uncharacterized protein LOC119740447 [Patiria miniata]